MSIPTSIINKQRVEINQLIAPIGFNTSTTPSLPANRGSICYDYNEDKLYTAKMTGWEELAVNMAPITNQYALDTIADLKNEPTMILNLVIDVLGYHAPFDCGGGSYVWEPANVLPPNDGTIILSNLTGTGRWIRECNGQPWNPRWFGAKGDGVTDDSTTIQKCISEAIIYKFDVKFGDGQFLLLNPVIITSSGEICISGNKDTQILSRPLANSYGFSFRSPGFTAKSLASNINFKDRTITLVDVIGISVGDIIRVVSNDQPISPTRPYLANTLRKVTAISGNTLTVDRKIRFNFFVGDAGLSVSHYTASTMLSPKISNLNFISQIPYLNGGVGIDFIGCLDININNCNFSAEIDPSKLQGTDLVRCTYCYGSRSTGCTFDGGRYGWLDNESTDARHYNTSCSNARHAFSPSVFSDGIYIDGLSGGNNDGLMDCHNSFDCHYNNVHGFAEHTFSNNRCIGGSVTNSYFSSNRSGANNTWRMTQNLFSNAGGNHIHDYTAVYQDYINDPDFNFTCSGVTFSNPSATAAEIDFAIGKSLFVSNTVITYSASSLGAFWVSAGVRDLWVNYNIENGNRYEPYTSFIRLPQSAIQTNVRESSLIAQDLTTVGGIFGTNIARTTNGSGYIVTASTSLSGGTGSGALCAINTTGGGGTVTDLDIIFMGSGYAYGDVLTVVGGNNDCTVTVDYNILSAINKKITPCVYGMVGDDMMLARGVMGMVNRTAEPLEAAVYALRIFYGVNALDVSAITQGIYSCKLVLKGSCSHLNTGRLGRVETWYHVLFSNATVPALGLVPMYTSPADSTNNTLVITPTSIITDNTGASANQVSDVISVSLLAANTNPKYQLAYEVWVHRTDI